ncbi:MAG: hypothetical protein ACNA8K_12945 [Cyclonatronaceae bacterium]
MTGYQESDPARGKSNRLRTFGLTTVPVTLMVLLFACILGPDARARQSSYITDAIRQLYVHFGSPEAAQFAQYGNMDVSLHKGVPAVTLPLHEFSLIGFSLPVYLSYNAGGIKVDEIAGDAGLGWTLFAGGQINQFVQGLNDLDHQRESRTTSLSAFDDFDPNLWDGIGPMDSDYEFAWEIFNPAFAGQPKNLKPDIFFYNYGGITGRFIPEGPGDS